MTLSEHLSGTDAVPLSKTAASLSSSIKQLCQHVRTWVNGCVDYCAAAALYDQLIRLPDAELHNRGLSRDTLFSDVCEWEIGAPASSGLHRTDERARPNAGACHAR